MATNRYTQISPSQFNPLSLEEVLMVPAMKRKQHDDVLAKQELVRAGLAKVDPLDVHFDEAVKLKKDLETQMDATATELAQKGFSPDMQAKAIALNRQYNDLISPTGRIGQINAAKQIYDKKKADFLKSATEQYGGDRAIQLWNQKSKNYTGYDKNFDKITNVDDYGIVAKQDYQKDLQTFHSLLGSTSREVAKGGGNVYYDPQLGGFKTTSSSISQATKDNIKQLNEMTKSLGNKWLSPSGEGFKYNQEAGVDPNNFATRFASDMLMQRERDTSNKQDFNVSFNEANQSGKGDDENLIDLEGVNVEGVSVGNNSDLLEKLEGKQTKTSFHAPYTAEGKVGGYNKPNKTTTISEARNSPEYLQIASAIARTKGLKDDLKSDKVFNEVKKYLSENKDTTIQNRYVDPNISKKPFLFASKDVTKNKTATSKLIMERARQGAYEVRDLQGNLIPTEDLGKYGFTYSGDMTPKSQIKVFGNPKQNIGARRGLIYDPETKKTTQVYVSRGADDFDTPQYKGMQLINNISRVTDTKPGIHHQFKIPAFEKFGISNFQVKYNKGKDSYNVSYTDNDGQHHSEPEMSDDKFQEYILNTQLIE